MDRKKPMKKQEKNKTMMCSESFTLDMKSGLHVSDELLWCNKFSQQHFILQSCPRCQKSEAGVTGLEFIY